MCGVVGFVNSGMRKAERIADLRLGIRGIAHRGPDEAGIYDDDHLSLGTVRLSVIDPRLGKQPMVTADERFVLGFNGEIFNYLELRQELMAAGVTFATESDTEVLLHSLAVWGEKSLDRLNGQFAFAFYDRRRHELLLGRDPFGERPLFYTDQDGAFAFASEVKGLFALPSVRRELSAAGVRANGRFWTPVPGESCFDGVRSLPPGHVLRVRPDGAELAPYFEVPIDRNADPASDRTFGGTFDEAKIELRDRVQEAVRFRLRGDYPLGAMLSGGLDSSIIASVVRQNTTGDLPTFSITVPAGGWADESEHQKVIAAHLGTDHTSVEVTGRDVRERFPNLVRKCEALLHFGAPVAVEMLAERIGRSGVRIVLGGEGADESFFGYDILKEATVLDSGPAGGATPAQEAALSAGLADVLLTDPTTPADILRFFQERPAPALSAHLRRFEAELFPGLVAADDAGDDDRRLLAFARSRLRGFDDLDMVGRSQWLDFQTFLSGYGMTCLADRPGAGCRIESRYPFVDRAVVDFAARLPREWKLRGPAREKHILREAYADVLPPEIRERPKFGMRIPAADHLLPTGAGDWVDEILTPGRVRACGVLDESRVVSLLDRVRSFPGGHVPYPYNHAYLQVLSVLLLQDSLVDNYRVPEVDIDRILLREFDGTGETLVRR
ncbi:asparagine synthase (glutamine-hydrolyzing) [Actinoplanes sp. NBRC 103695]|uniref:asparagine synthase (glutamine-hydrolyzing) n=1 Tax=Actinoplanes sp. NBRC 103695 TaxID=3032202 RepID=UPI0024A25C74|nr:asparagine synthase (glutamine-hydrolyzing) [Actinoplanes sp. NBRC 103695]GLZ00964.1 asparagine synthetase B [Actinoplanes sp. NBRC 103695]